MKVSFIVTSYNQETFISECIVSILGQTTLPDELIISDDASTDGTWSMILETLRQTPNHGIKVILNRNSENLGVARNFGYALTKASGDIYIFGAGDDVYLADKVLLTLEYFGQHKSIAGMFTNLVEIDALSFEKGRFFSRIPRFSRNQHHIFLLRQPWCIGASQAVRASVINNYMETPFTGISTDGVMAFRSIMEGGFGYLDEVTVKYRIHGNNLSQGLSFDQKLEYFIGKLCFYSELIINARHRGQLFLLPSLYFYFIVYSICNKLISVNRLNLLLRKFYSG